VGLSTTVTHQIAENPKKVVIYTFILLQTLKKTQN